MHVAVQRGRSMVFDAGGRSEVADVAQLAVAGEAEASRNQPCPELIIGEMVETIYRRCRKFGPAGSDEIEKLRIRRILVEASDLLGQRTIRGDV